MIEHRELKISTSQREELVDITHKVKELIPNDMNGAVVISSPHTTAGITIQENADPDVKRDLLYYLKKLIPIDPSFRHAEGNSDAHIKTSLIGTSVTIPVVNGEIVFGTWQAIYFCEFDGPRSRRVHITLIK